MLPKENSWYPFAEENVFELSYGLKQLQNCYKNLCFVGPKMRSGLAYRGYRPWKETLPELQKHIDAGILNLEFARLVVGFEVGLQEIFYNALTHGSFKNPPLVVQCDIDMLDQRRVTFSNLITRQDIKKELRAKGRKTVTICGLTGVTSFWDTLRNQEEGEKGWDVDYNVEDIRVAYETGSKLPRTFCISVRRR